MGKSQFSSLAMNRFVSFLAGAALSLYAKYATHEWEITEAYR